MNSSADAWDAFAATRTTPRTVNGRGERTWFNWTQYTDHGPGAEVLGDAETILDLGCGGGRNVAHLASLGRRATGVDLSPARIVHAKATWATTEPAPRFVQADAAVYLLEREEQWDAITSVFGAVWFTEPDMLLPLIAERLSPGGQLVFSHEPPIDGCYGCQGAYIRPPGGGAPYAVKRWAYTVDMWSALLVDKYGFADARGDVIAAPTPDGVPTMLVRATR